jgi:hypothetical protein
MIQPMVVRENKRLLEGHRELGKVGLSAGEQDVGC